MSEEIKIPCKMWPSTITNPAAYWDELDQTNDVYNPAGLVFPDGEIADLHFKMCAPIPSDINSTPVGKIRVVWTTPAASTSTVFRLYYKIDGFTRGTDSVDPSSFTLDSYSDVTSAGALLETTSDIALTSIAAKLVSGRIVYGTLRRDARASNANDTLTDLSMVLEILFVADKT